MRRQSSGILLAHEFITPNGRRWQGGSGSRFHPNSRVSAVHGWIRCPCKRGSGTILLAGSPRGGSVARPSSLPDERPFQFLLLKAFWFFGVQAGVSARAVTRGS